MSTALVNAYLLAVGVLTGARIGLGWPSVHSIALTPALFAHGKVWLLVTSGFLVATASPAAALLALAALAGTAVCIGNARRFWSAAIAGHVGSTILTYVGIAVLWLTHVRSVDALIDQPDYGISCVWAGALGAVAFGALHDPRHVRRLVVPAVSFACVGLLTISSRGLALPEHVVAFALGALVGWRLPQRFLVAS